mmetsp:Transcript_5213/g.5977  ORF Transcript_5213/g.5977 Transcript_5213/m.5977 type:complete len:380 (+) Transcript_5213:49-1188(+)
MPGSMALRLLLISLLGVTDASDVVELSDSTWTERLVNNPEEGWFVDFFAPWCHHCKILHPIYEQLATDLKGSLHVARVDCTQNRMTCMNNRIAGYPTLKYYHDGRVKLYRGMRDLGSLKEYLAPLADQLAPVEAVPVERDVQAAVLDVDAAGKEVVLLKRGDGSNDIALEPVLLLLIAIRAEYHTSSLSEEEWAVMRNARDAPPHPHLPLLNDKANGEEVWVSHPGSMLRHLARKHSVYGATALDQLTSDELIETTRALRTAWSAVDQEDHPSVEAHMESLVPVLETLEALVGDDMVFARSSGGAPSVGDVVVLDLVHRYSQTRSSGIRGADLLARHPKLLQFLQFHQSRAGPLQRALLGQEAPAAEGLLGTLGSFFSL